MLDHLEDLEASHPVSLTEFLDTLGLCEGEPDTTAPSYKGDFRFVDQEPTF